jgi:hypothetical protein
MRCLLLSFYFGMGNQKFKAIKDELLHRHRGSTSRTSWLSWLQIILIQQGEHEVSEKHTKRANLRHCRYEMSKIRACVLFLQKRKRSLKNSVIYLICSSPVSSTGHINFHPLCPCPLGQLASTLQKRQKYLYTAGQNYAKFKEPWMGVK